MIRKVKVVGCIDALRMCSESSGFLLKPNIIFWVRSCWIRQLLAKSIPRGAVHSHHAENRT